MKKTIECIGWKVINQMFYHSEHTHTTYTCTLRYITPNDVLKISKKKSRGQIHWHSKKRSTQHNKKKPILYKAINRAGSKGSVQSTQSPRNPTPLQK